MPGENFKWLKMNLKVLFLDDEAMLCDIFTDFFTAPNIDIITFTEPTKAIEYSNKNDLDIIILDYRMPRITGDKIAAQMPSEIPKYLLTGELDPNPDFIFTGIIKKPFDSTAMRAILNEFWINKQVSVKKSA